jgi:iron complex transport system ATP-binding protein
MSEPTAIELSDVHVGYPHSPDDVLRGVSAAVEAERLCALLGPNGSGKSTLIRVVAGLLTPRQGTVSVDGRRVDEMSREERAIRIALVPQRSEVAFGFRVREVVAMGRAPHQGALMRQTRADRDAVEAAIDVCSLEPLAERPLAELSGGEQQRVHFARALAQEPAVLLLDEAAAHLDVRHQEELFTLVRQQIRDRGMTCLAAMHDFNAALRHADDALVLEEGAVAGAGEAAEVLRPPLLSRVFGVPLETGTLPSGSRVLAVSGREASARK